MRETHINTCQEMGFKVNDTNSKRVQQVIYTDDICNYDAMESDLDDSLDQSSSSSSSSSPLFQLSDLMAHLPIKRGISKFYQGRSESFVSLTSVKSGADLAKKENKYCCRSYGQGQSQRLSPKPTIAKARNKNKNKKLASSSSSSTITKSSAFSSLTSTLMAT